jgi:hypothetical protein
MRKSRSTKPHSIREFLNTLITASSLIIGFSITLITASGYEEVTNYHLNSQYAVISSLCIVSSTTALCVFSLLAISLSRFSDVESERWWDFHYPFYYLALVLYLIGMFMFGATGFYFYSFRLKMDIWAASIAWKSPSIFIVISCVIVGITLVYIAVTFCLLNSHMNRKFNAVEPK